MKLTILPGGLPAVVLNLLRDLLPRARPARSARATRKVARTALRRPLPDGLIGTLPFDLPTPNAVASRPQLGRQWAKRIATGSAAGGRAVAPGFYL